MSRVQSEGRRIGCSRFFLFLGQAPVAVTHFKSIRETRGSERASKVEVESFD